MKTERVKRQNEWAKDFIPAYRQMTCEVCGAIVAKGWYRPSEEYFGKLSEEEKKEERKRMRRARKRCIFCLDKKD